MATLRELVEEEWILVTGLPPTGPLAKAIITEFIEGTDYFMGRDNIVEEIDRIAWAMIDDVSNTSGRLQRIASLLRETGIRERKGQ